MRFEPTKVDAYINATYAQEDTLLRRIRELGESIYAGMQVGPYEGQLLHCLVKMIHAKRVLEIGAFVGYSSVCMARALPDDGELLTCERQADHAEYTRQHLADYPNASVLEGDALEQIATLDGPFDMVFIDAEKRSYLKYLDTILPKLRVGGLLVADNTLLFGAMLGEEPEERVSQEAIDVMQAFNKRLADEARFTSVMLPTSQGLALAIKG